MWLLLHCPVLGFATAVPCLTIVSPTGSRLSSVFHLLLSGSSLGLPLPLTHRNLYFAATFLAPVSLWPLGAHPLIFFLYSPSLSCHSLWTSGGKPFPRWFRCVCRRASLRRHHSAGFRCGVPLRPAHLALVYLFSPLLFLTLGFDLQLCLMVRCDFVRSVASLICPPPYRIVARVTPVFFESLF